MEPLDEYQLQPNPATPVDRGGRRRVLVGAVIILAVVGAATFYLWRRAAPATPRTASPPAEARAPADERRPLGAAVEARALPPLDESDPLVRELLGALSSHPQIIAWLASDGLIRRFVVSIDNVAAGASPARHSMVLAPTRPFEAVTRGDTLTIADRSFERYNALADAVASLDPTALAQLYSTLKPRLVEAYVELGHPGGDLDGAVEQALVRLLDTPVPGSSVAVTPGIESFKFRQDRVETLSAAQKQLVRMGPRNVRLIQGQLWSLGRELGIPSERLPAPPR